MSGWMTEINSLTSKNSGKKTLADPVVNMEEDEEEVWVEEDQRKSLEVSADENEE